MPKNAIITPKWHFFKNPYVVKYAKWHFLKQMMAFFLSADLATLRKRRGIPGKSEEDTNLVAISAQHTKMGRGG